MKKFKMPHALVIMVMIILLAVVMTWIVPAGQFARIENAEGVKVVDPHFFSVFGKFSGQPVKGTKDDRGIPDFQN